MFIVSLLLNLLEKNLNKATTSFNLNLPFVFLEMLETIDDEISTLAPRVSFVRIDDADVALEYGLSKDKPSLVFFEDGLPK